MRKVPTTVLTGYLGAGKTTLLNRIVGRQHDRKFAVIVNEFGEVGIDNQLVLNADEEIVEMNNGCICCSVRGDLMRGVRQLFERVGDIEHLLIETTGLADPGPVLQSFFIDEVMYSRLTLDAVVTVVDCLHALSHWDSDELHEQIAFADIILLNKTDLTDPGEVERVEDRIRALNPLAKLHRTVLCDAPLSALLGVGAFDLRRALSIDPGLLEDTGHEHDQSVCSVSLCAEGPVDGFLLNAWLNQLIQIKGRDIFRMKGIVNLENEDRRFVFQGVHMTLDGMPGQAWRPGEARTNQLVFIGRSLDESALRSGFEACMQRSAA